MGKNLCGFHNSPASREFRIRWIRLPIEVDRDILCKIKSFSKHKVFTTDETIYAEQFT